MKLRSLLALGLVALAPVAFALDEATEALLTKMRDAYKGVKAARLQTHTVLYVEGEELSATFEVSFKNPNKVRATTDKLFGHEGLVKIICDGRTITVSTPEGKEEMPFSIEALSDGAPLNLETLCFWDWKRQLSTGTDGNMAKSELKILKEQKWNEKEWLVLEETAKGQEVFVKYWIDPKTHLIWRTQVFTLDGATKVMECTIKKLDTDVELDDAVFDGE